MFRTFLNRLLPTAILKIIKFLFNKKKHHKFAKDSFELKMQNMLSFRKCYILPTNLWTVVQNQNCVPSSVSWQHLFILHRLPYKSLSLRCPPSPLVFFLYPVYIETTSAILIGLHSLTLATHFHAAVAAINCPGGPTFIMHFHAASYHLIVRWMALYRTNGHAKISGLLLLSLCAAAPHTLHVLRHLSQIAATSWNINRQALS